MKSHVKSSLVMLITFAVSVATLGCGRSASMNSWQRQLERHAELEGDSSFLRAAGASGAPEPFSIISSNSPEKSTDVRGVLLGRHRVRDSHWLIFLVGTVKNQQVEDVRVAMAQDDPSHSGERHWLWSKEDDRSTELYRKYRESSWRKNHPNRDDPPWPAMQFPAESDIFRLEIAGNTVSVVEERSGVRWTLLLEEQREAKAASSPSTLSAAG